jgi:hypothetical protein
VDGRYHFASFKNRAASMYILRQPFIILPL